jgi:hypothetical protein
MGAIFAAAVASAGTASASCPVPRLTDSQRHAANVRVQRQFHRRKRERAHDLMGYRDGPRLGPPSRSELRRISYARENRLFFGGLNPNRLLVRRLLRDHSGRVVRGWDGLEFPMTRIEQRDMAFQERVISSQGTVERFGKRCARRTYAGEFPTVRWPAGIRIHVLFTGHLRRNARRLAARYPYERLVIVRRARFTLVQLNAVDRRIERDHEELERAGVDISIWGVDEEHNQVLLGVESITRAGRAEVRRRYGAKVRIEHLSVSEAARARGS